MPADIEDEEVFHCKFYYCFLVIYFVQEVYAPEVDDDEDYNTGGSVSSYNKSINTRLRSRKSKGGSTETPEDDSLERQVISFQPEADMEEDHPTRQKFVS